MKRGEKNTRMGPALSFILLTVLITGCTVDEDSSLPVDNLTGFKVKPAWGLLTTDIGGKNSFTVPVDIFENEIIVNVTEKVNVEPANGVKKECAGTVEGDGMELSIRDRKGKLATYGTRDASGKGVQVETPDADSYSMVIDEQNEGEVINKTDRQNQEISPQDGLMRFESAEETTARNKKSSRSGGYESFISTDSSARVNDIFKDEDSFNKYLREVGTFYRYLGESRENMIGLYFNLIDREVGVNIISGDIDLHRDGTTRIRPISYSFFIGRVLPPIKPEKPKKPEKPEKCEFEQTEINPRSKATEILESSINSLTKDYGNIGVRADIGCNCYITAIFNPFTDKASTYVKLKRTLYNDEGGTIADISVKGAATYGFDEQVWSAAVKAQVNVPFMY